MKSYIGDFYETNAGGLSKTYSVTIEKLKLGYYKTVDFLGMNKPSQIIIYCVL